MSAARSDSVSADSGVEGQRSEAPSTGEEEPVRDSAGANAELPLDQVFEILKNSRRREVLQYLRDNEDADEVTLGEVAEHIAAIENDTTVDAISSSERKRVYVGLYQCHLPKMDDMNIVRFNQNRGHIELAENAAQLEQYIDRDETGVRNWPLYYGSIAVGAAVAFAGTLVAGVATGLTSALILGGLIVAIGVCAAAQDHVTRSEDSEE